MLLFDDNKVKGKEAREETEGKYNMLSLFDDEIKMARKPGKM